MSLYLFLVSPIATAIAADNTSAELHSERTHIIAANDLGPEGPEPGGATGAQSSSTSRLKRSSPPPADASDDSNKELNGDTNREPGNGADRDGGRSDYGNSESDEMPMPAPSLLKQANPTQNDSEPNAVVERLLISALNSR